MSRGTVEEDLVKSLEFTAEIGHFGVLVSKLAAFKSKIDGAANDEIKARYLRLCEIAAEGVAYEHVHGVGSLLNIDHPVVKRFIAAGNIIDPRVVETAVRARNIR